MRKTIASLSCAAILLSNAAGVFGQTYTDITNSGSGLDVKNTTNTTTVVTIDQTNSAFVKQDSTNVVKTGDVEVKGNIATGTGCGTCTLGTIGVTTGAGTATTVQEVDVNNNTAAAEVTGGSATSVLGLVNTGKDVTIDTSANSTTVLTEQQANKAFVSQSSMNLVDTGGVVASNNIGNVDVTTGPGTAVTVQKIKANENTALAVVKPAPTTVLPPMCGLNPCGAGLVGANGAYTMITNTGNKLIVDNHTNNTTVLGLLQSNLLYSSQKAGNYVTTGDVVAKKNIGGVDITTGAGVGSTLMELVANKNTAAASIGSDEMPLGGSLLQLVNTGVNANVDASANDTTVVGGKQNNLSFIFEKTCNYVQTGLVGVLKNVGMVSTLTGVGASGVGQSTTANTNTFLVTSSPLGLLGLLLALTL
ncbi:hypothetical protein A3C23_02680 [Candidatus Roizmanbacteria bacterium RIFCSPHIGHO2_02_FULL_37_13b]|uniref:Uncharacterized protein n=1 Tax=Candidatus Roizmanbacteria bacterium RIFCSPLOWO2_02_FULL_36_11 TaxID=1802071 RepID=A0A1F7JG37_9BACT|nr:MAG: hypothetical protein A3C23_02680 [Candidatus Roizmanbacteria bacterium RIFCSPHIGHO2_02_FULL_37_13b]OGK54580.1 MAG: hypothetical protein A3H78_01700 [Candidatus Roizmanbacteria bacterium RIFCSPLOWO2_02_FULL_36_11]